MEQGIPRRSVLIDGLTLQSAGRILSGHGYRQDASHKWDYSTYEQIKVASDLECLAQIVHSIVFHDKLVTIPIVRPVDKSGWVQMIAGQLTDVHSEIELTPSVVRENLLQAAAQANDAAHSRELRDYLALLSRGGIDGALIDISNGYFITGYADRELLPFAEIDRPGSRTVPMLEAAIDAVKVERAARDKELDELRNQFSELGKRIAELSQVCAPLDAVIMHAHRSADTAAQRSVRASEDADERARVAVQRYLASLDASRRDVILAGATELNELLATQTSIMHEIYARRSTPFPEDANLAEIYKLENDIDQSFYRQDHALSGIVTRPDGYERASVEPGVIRNLCATIFFADLAGDNGYYISAASAPAVAANFLGYAAHGESKGDIAYHTVRRSFASKC